MVENDLQVLPRLRDLLPKLSDEEREQLEANIVTDGRVRDPILYWNNGHKNLIVDGMNRYEIAKRKNLPFRTEPMEFKSIEEVELWMLNNALGRRNLMKPLEVRKIRGELYNRLKGDRGGRRYPPEIEAKCQNDTLTSGAAETVAERSGVSVATVKRDGKRREEIESLVPAVAKAIDEGRLEVSDKELHALAKADPTTQQQVARAVRTGAAKSTADALHQSGVKVSAPKRDLENCEHSWVADGNGERYCEHCKVDHPDNPKKPEEPEAVKHLKGIAKTIEHLRVKIDDIVREHGKHGLTDVILKDMDKALVNLKKWAAAVKK